MDQQTKNRLYLLGRPLSPLYGSAMKARAWFYRKGIFKQHRLSVPVVSVGNLTMGGTGKTPFIIYLARLLGERGFKAAVVCRGYRGKSRAPVNIVCDGEQLLMTSRDAGDEPVMMARKLPSAIVATGRKRALPARQAVETYRADLILLDDGFQHLSLYRDIDLVLFDIDHFAGNSRVFPGGELREPVTALSRCDAFVLTGLREDNRDRAASIEQLLLEKFPDKESFRLSRSFSSCIRYDFNGPSLDMKQIDMTDVAPKLFAFSGIAHPERFYRMLESSGCDVMATRDFGDHHAYRQKDISLICEEARKNCCSALITTEKDMVKFDSSHRFSLPIFTPVLEYAVHEGLLEFITHRICQRKND